MATAGIDVGINTTKAVIVNQESILSYAVAPGGRESIAAIAEKALNQAAEKAHLSTSDLEYIMATGSTDGSMPIGQGHLPDSISLAKGINWLLPSVRAVLDMGAQKSLAVNCQEGKATKVARNGRCAAGSGNYLEMVAKIFRVGLEDMADLSSKSTETLEVQSICAVFAESEIISLIHAKKNPTDVLKGVLCGLAQRIYPLLAQVSFEKDVAMVGGVARNKGMVMAIQELVGYDILVPDNPDIVAALGAALIAEERVRSAN